MLCKSHLFSLFHLDQKLPKPSITVKPWIAVLNGNVTIHCKADKPYNMLDFYLLKKGRYSWTAKAAYLDSVDYPIINVTKRLLGWYYCIYCARTQLGRQCSEESEDANISLIGELWGWFLNTVFKNDWKIRF